MVSRDGNDFGIDRVMIRELESDCCLDCDEIATLVTDFETATGYTIASTGNFWELFATTANSDLNFTLTAIDYQHFHEDCIAGNPGRPYILPGGNRILQDAARMVRPTNTPIPCMMPRLLPCPLSNRKILKPAAAGLS